VTFKTVFVDSYFKTKNALLGEKQLDLIDGEKLSRHLEDYLNELEYQGYTIVDIVPVISGNDNYRNGIGYGYAYSFTDGVIIVAKKS
jgi:hypothetical protein